MLDLFQMFNIYLKKAQELYGLPHTRPIYEHAISVLPEDSSRWVLAPEAEFQFSYMYYFRIKLVIYHVKLDIFETKLHFSKQIRLLN